MLLLDTFGGFIRASSIRIVHYFILVRLIDRRGDNLVLNNWIGLNYLIICYLRLILCLIVLIFRNVWQIMLLVVWDRGSRAVVWFLVRWFAKLWMRMRTMPILTLLLNFALSLRLRDSGSLPYESLFDINLEIFWRAQLFRLIYRVVFCVFLNLLLPLYLLYLIIPIYFFVLVYFVNRGLFIDKFLVCLELLCDAQNFIGELPPVVFLEDINLGVYLIL